MNEIVPVYLIRHAQSTWNKENRFSGWANPPLTELGEAEALRAGKLLAEQDIRFDVVYSSPLQRSKHTAEIILQEMGNSQVPIIEDWRRGFYDRPPALLASDSRHPRFESLFDTIPRSQLPLTESLEDTEHRVMTFWAERIDPDIERGRKVLICSHGNTLRAVINVLSGMSVDEVEQFEIPTGQPMVYAFRKDGAVPESWHYLSAYTGDHSTIEAANHD